MSFIDNFEVKQTNKKGKGLFSKKYFEPNQVILKFEGKRIKASEIDNLADTITYDYLQIAPDLYLDPRNTYTVFANHSCNPNTKIVIQVNLAFLVSIKSIKPGDEITFDYATSSTENTDTFKINCQCGAYSCRKIISGFPALTEEEKKKLKDKNIVVYYLT